MCSCQTQSLAEWIPKKGQTQQFNLRGVESMLKKWSVPLNMTENPTYHQTEAGCRGVWIIFLLAGLVGLNWKSWRTSWPTTTWPDYTSSSSIGLSCFRFDYWRVCSFRGLFVFCCVLGLTVFHALISHPMWKDKMACLWNVCTLHFALGKFWPNG